MPDFSQGKIYKIVGDDGSTYYGSTTRTLRLRKGEHGHHKTTTAYQHIISKMAWDMILVENFPCESRKELERREGTYILENPCVNRVVVGRTPKEFYDQNREELLKISKVYYEHNREAVCARNKVYYAANRDSEIAKRKIRYADNLEASLKYAKRRDRWIRTFGSRKCNNIQKCDPSLFQ